MSNLQPLNNLSKRIRTRLNSRGQNQISFNGYLPLASLIIRNPEEQILCVLGNADYQRKLVLSDLHGNIMKTFLDLKTDNVLLSENQTHIFVLTYNQAESTIYKFSKPNMQYETSVKIKGTIQSFVTTDTNIYAFDMKRGTTLEINLTTQNVYTKDNKEYNHKTTRWTHTFLSTYKDGYISIGLPNNEREFLEFKNFLKQHFGPKIAQQNDQISSLAYDKTRNRLFISFSNFIAIIEEGLCTSIIYFKKKGIVSLNYNNDPNIDTLSICYSNLQQGKVDGDILTLTPDRINQLRIRIDPFDLLNGFASKVEDLPALNKPKTKELLPNQ